MRKTYAIVVLALAAILVPAAALFAQEAEEITGRQIVEQGTVGTVAGTLVADGVEWQLQAGEKLYELHLGQFGHDGKTTAALKAGAEATVNGFIYGDHVSPITLVSGDATLRFRNQDGSPLWAGMRLGPNAQDRPGDGAPAGNRSGANGTGANGTGWGRNRTQG